MNQQAYPAPAPQKTSSVTKIIVGLSCCGGCLLVIIVLAAVAIPAFISYIKKSKTAEAEIQLQVLASSVETAFAQTGQMTGATGPIPAVPGAERQIGGFALDPTFSALGFDPGPTFFSYSIMPTPARWDRHQAVRLIAQGDLDGDGIQSMFEVTVSCERGQPCIRAMLRRTNELE